MPAYGGYGRWAPYVPVAKRQQQAAKEMAKLQKAGHRVEPVEIEGRKIATTFWGNAWCDSLESYRDYENRLPRGRTYVRNGSVVDLQIAPRKVTAIVSGSELYRVSIQIEPVPKAQWHSICADCASGIDSLIELLQGKLSQGVMHRLCDQKTGLFPPPKAIRFSCTCPDSASLCKHVAASLYGVGARLDSKPELLFLLRDVDAKDLVRDLSGPLPIARGTPGSTKVLADDDLGAMFGIDMAEDAPPVAASSGAAAPATTPVAKRKEARVTKTAEPKAKTVPTRGDGSAADTAGSSTAATQARPRAPGAPVASRKGPGVAAAAAVGSPAAAVAAPSGPRRNERRGAGAERTPPDRVVRWVGARRAKSKTRGSA